MLPHSHGAIKTSHFDLCAHFSVSFMSLRVDTEPNVSTHCWQVR